MIILAIVFGLIFVVIPGLARPAISDEGYWDTIKWNWKHLLVCTVEDIVVGAVAFGIFYLFLLGVVAVIA